MLDMVVFCYDDPLRFYGLFLDLYYMLLVVNVTLNYISVVLWLSVLYAEETSVP